jgi:hypothetical protein
MRKIKSHGGLRATLCLLSLFARACGLPTVFDRAKVIAL